MPLAFHPSLLNARAAARFIHRMAADERPFCLVYSCHEPHPEFVSPRPFDRMYEPADMPLPETRHDNVGPRLLRNRADRQLKPAPDGPSGDDDLRAMWAGYYGAVSYVDHLVGIILAALVESDQFDDTLFIFTSDHGEMLGSHGLLFKGAVLYEELVNIPLLIRPPGGLAAGAPHRPASDARGPGADHPAVVRRSNTRRAAGCGHRRAGYRRQRACTRRHRAGIPLLQLGPAANAVAGLAHGELEICGDHRRR